MQTRDDRFLLHLESRFQFRFAYPNDEDPLDFDAVISDSPIFKINRARLKMGGNAFAHWLKYYWEYELGQGNLLNFRLMVEKWKFLKFKAGQWKTIYIGRLFRILYPKMIDIGQFLLKHLLNHLNLFKCNIGI